jgi:hypothetical protein
MFYWIIVLLFVVIGAIICYIDSYECFPGMMAGAVIGGLISIFIFAWASEHAEVELVAEEKTTVVACVLQQVQTSRSSSTAHIVWTDENGIIHETAKDGVVTVDSTDYCRIVKKYETKGWFMKMLYSKDDEVIFYVPYDVLYHGNEAIRE